MRWDGETFDLGELDPPDDEWINRTERIVVAHPTYPSQRHDVEVWVVRGPDGIR